MPVMHRVKSEMARRMLARLPLEKMVPETRVGAGVAREAGALAAGLGVSKALLVTDRIVLQLGLAESCLRGLEEAGVQVVVYDGVEPDPAVELVERGVDLYQREGCDGIVAVGGGSSIDCAKVIGARVSNPDKPVARLAQGMQVRQRPPPLIAVPTTHGTGSETTYAAVITDASRKLLVTDFKLMPRAALLDPELVLGLPQAVSAATGMDALTHGVESFLSPWATDASRARSLSAVRGVMGNLLRTFHDPTDVAARTAMLQASFDAGVAIGVGAVGYVHAIAHAIGVEFHTPHGTANAMILPLVLDFYGSAAWPGLAQLAVACDLGQSSDGPRALAERFVGRIRAMNYEMGLPTFVKELRPKDVARVAEQALQEAHGERHSMLSDFGKFMQDVGYPTVRYMGAADCRRIVAGLLPPKGAAAARL